MTSSKTFQGWRPWEGGMVEIWLWTLRAPVGINTDPHTPPGRPMANTTPHRNPPTDLMTFKTGGGEERDRKTEGTIKMVQGPPPPPHPPRSHGAQRQHPTDMYNRAPSPLVGIQRGSGLEADVFKYVGQKGRKSSTSKGPNTLPQSVFERLGPSGPPRGT